MSSSLEHRLSLLRKISNLVSSAEKALNDGLPFYFSFVRPSCNSHFNHSTQRFETIEFTTNRSETETFFDLPLGGLMAPSQFQQCQSNDDRDRLLSDLWSQQQLVPETSLDCSVKF